jgi:twitching motility protein PilJ
MTVAQPVKISRPGSALIVLLAAAAALAVLGALAYYFLATERGAAAALPRGLAVLGPVALGALSALLVAAAAVMTARLHRTVAAQRLAAETQRQENDRNQQAILRLLDELSSLADGDLTVQATVTEDITGAIADSINYAVDALRGLVTTINQSAIQLDSATRQTQALSQHLAKASGAQSKQISSATESAAGMAGSVAEVSGNAERAADVARHSVEVAHKGGDAVRRTIDGMNTIRETIQETSKRIKRLGESSQEIGNIVELINDIAEQTNILALNASIQASMAGEAGRGFAVVADEVQRLAERAANATKQIEVLVRTIQTDTNEAVVSMERSTTDVVGGALLAENAGAALEEIEQVSNQIASLVQNISASSRQQTGGAQNIARNMQVLKEISVQTAESTNATSTAIAKLAELSAGLRRAAAGFRLPGTTSEPGPGASGAFRRAAPGTASDKPTAAAAPMAAPGGRVPGPDLQSGRSSLRGEPLAAARSPRGGA